MADYKKLYLYPFNEITDTIDALKIIQENLEKKCIEMSEPEIKIIKK